MVFRSRARRIVACAAVLALGFPYAAAAHGNTEVVAYVHAPAGHIVRVRGHVSGLDVTKDGTLNLRIREDVKKLGIRRYGSPLVGQNLVARTTVAAAATAAPSTAAPSTAAPAPPAPAPAAPLPAPPAPAANGPTVVSVDVSGNAHVPTDKILSVVRTRAGQPFDERLVREDLQNIFDLGYFTDQVPPLIRQRPDGIAITFRVIENPVVQRIEFTGNDHVPADTLLALMDTAVGQVLNTNTFHQDVLKINSYYDKIGYSGQVPTHVSGLNITPQGTLSLSVREGLTVSGIDIVGDPLISKGLILKAISLKEGQPYSDDARDKDYDTLKKLYEKYDVQLGDFEAGIDPTTVDLVKGTARVKYSLYAAKVGAVEITGNTKTKDVVIRRQLRLRPGMYITQGLLKTDDQRLNNLGFFDKVDLNAKPGPDPKKPYELTLDWNVKEQRTGTAQVGAGYSGGPTGQGLTGTLSYSENNIGGNGNSGSVRVERGARVSDGSISYSVPYLGNTKTLQKYSLAASIFTSAQSNYYQIYQASTAGTVGVSQVVSTPLPSGSSGGSGGVAGTIPVVLTPNSNPLSAAALYGQRSNGVSLNVGRRLSDTLTTTLGLSVQRLGTDVTLPTGYYLFGSADHPQQQRSLDLAVRHGDQRHDARHHRTVDRRHVQRRGIQPSLGFARPAKRQSRRRLQSAPRNAHLAHGRTLGSRDRIAVPLHDHDARHREILSHTLERDARLPSARGRCDGRDPAEQTVRPHGPAVARL